jgi:hypothetical protein
MHENKFEKQIREKMDQLGFDPSDKVWTEVGEAINSEKKRRRPIFWIFFLSGLIVAGGAMYMVLNKRTGENVRVEDKGQIASDLPAENKKENESAQKTVSGNSTSLSVSGNSRISQSTNSLPQFKSKISRPNNSKLENVSISIGKKENQKTPQNVAPSNGDALVAGSNTPGSTNHPDSTVAQNKLNKTNLIDSVYDSKSAKTKTKEAAKSPWSIGFTGGLGVSNINQSLFQSYSTAALYNTNLPANQTPGTTIHTPSELHSGFSFAAGISVKRSFSKRISATAGLGYHYYSTSMNTGASVDSSFTVYYSAIAQAASINSFYRNGEEKSFTNQYHFIELPINLVVQLNKNTRNPINWEAGFSLAWLAGANALQFDPATNVYFKNNQLFNRIQWDAQTAVLFGFPVQKHTLQVGPQFQYGLSNLLKTSSSYQGHLSYFGLKFSFNR